MKCIYVFFTMSLMGMTLAALGQRPGGGEGGGTPRNGEARGSDSRPAATLSAITQNLKKFEGFYNFYYDE